MGMRSVITKIESLNPETYAGFAGELWLDNISGRLHVGSGATPGGNIAVTTDATGNITLPPGGTINYSDGSNALVGGGGGNGSSLINGSYSLALESNGNLTLPGGVAQIAVEGDGGVRIGDAALNTAPNTQIKIGGANNAFEIFGGPPGYSWTFGTDSTLRFPGDNFIQENIEATGLFGVEALDGFTVLTGAGASQQWIFDDSGNLTLPKDSKISETTPATGAVATIVVNQGVSSINGALFVSLPPPPINDYNIPGTDIVIDMTFGENPGLPGYYGPTSTVVNGGVGHTGGGQFGGGEVLTIPYVDMGITGGGNWTWYVNTIASNLVLTAGVNTWTFGANGATTLPTGGVFTSPDYNFSFNNDTGNFGVPTLGTVVTSEGGMDDGEIFMGSGYGEFRSIYNNVGSTSSGLVYAGVEGFNYAQYGDVNFAGMVSQTPNIDSMYTIGLNTSDQITIGFTQDGQTQQSTDWSVTVGTLNTDMTVNGLFANTNTTVIGSGLSSWTFGSTGNLTLPIGGHINAAPTVNYGNGNSIVLTAGSTNGCVSVAGSVVINAGNGNTIQKAGNILLNTQGGTWEFSANGATTLPNGAKLSNGTSLQFATDNTVVTSLDLRDTTGRGFYTDSDGFSLRANGSKTWTFDGAGNLTLPPGGTVNYSDGSNALVGGGSAGFNPTTLVQNIAITGAISRSGDGNFTVNYTATSHAPINSTGIVASCEGITVYAEGNTSTDSQSVNGGFGSGHGDRPYTAYAFVTTNVGTIWSTVAAGSTGLCLIAGTRVTMADGTTKLIEDISYSDQIQVWDFDTAGFASATALWIKRVETAVAYNELMFSDGSVLRTVDQHRIFNKQAGAFTYPMTDDTPLGTITYTVDDAEVVLVGKRVVTGTVDYYNVITDGHMNLFANGILTSCRFSNAYPIDNMRWVKNHRPLRDRAEFTGIADRWINGLRLCEQTYTVADIRWYVTRLESLESLEIADLALAA